jgi:hypothetical protein
MGRMRAKYWPGSVLGTWSVRLVALAAVFFIFFFLLVASGQKGGDTFFSNPLLSIPILVAFGSAVCAFFTGIVSIFRNGERAILVYVATVIGLFLLIIGLGEVIFPH